MAEQKVNWKFIVIFYSIAFILSAPVNSFYFIDQWQQATAGTIFYKIPFLASALGTLIAAFLAFHFDKKTIRTITLWGDNKFKSTVLSLIPALVLTVTGITNDLGLNEHVYALIICLVIFVYALSEEIFWRGYLINALAPLGWVKNYALLGLLWWFWHFNFLSLYGITTFLFLILISSFLIGKFVEGTRSYLTAAGLHSLIVILTVGENNRSLLYAGAVSTILWIIVDKFWKKV